MQNDLSEVIELTARIRSQHITTSIMTTPDVVEHPVTMSLDAIHLTGLLDVDQTKQGAREPFNLWLHCEDPLAANPHKKAPNDTSTKQTTTPAHHRHFGLVKTDSAGKLITATLEPRHFERLVPLVTQGKLATVFIHNELHGKHAEDLRVIAIQLSTDPDLQRRTDLD